MGKMHYLDDDETTSEPGEDIRWVARRQFCGSTVAALMIAAASWLVAARPAHVRTTEVGSHRGKAVKQPSFVSAPDNRLVESTWRRVELP
jgi:hypothetical protein